MGRYKHIAVVLAGGKGSRMNSDTPKQYIELKGNPVLYYSLKIFEDSFMDAVVLVCGNNAKRVKALKGHVQKKHNGMCRDDNHNYHTSEQ